VIFIVFDPVWVFHVTVVRNMSQALQIGFFTLVQINKTSEWSLLRNENASEYILTEISAKSVQFCMLMHVFPVLFILSYNICKHGFQGGTETTVVGVIVTCLHAVPCILLIKK
jgi:hypothetical protein